MPAVTLAVTIDSALLHAVDRRVAAGEFPNRDRAIQLALQRLVAEHQGEPNYLAALELLDPAEETTLAEERLAAEVPWPEA